MSEGLGVSHSGNDCFPLPVLPICMGITGGVKIAVPKLVKDEFCSSPCLASPEGKQCAFDLAPCRKKKFSNYNLSCFRPRPESGFHLSHYISYEQLRLNHPGKQTQSTARLTPASNLSPDGGRQGLVSVHHHTFSLNSSLPSSWFSQILILLPASLFLLLAWPSDLTQDTALVLISLVSL